MSFLNNFKYQYHIKYLENLLGSKDYPGMFNYLNNLKSNKKLFHDLSLKYINDAINKSEQDILKCKIVWISSYLNNDYEYIVSFIESYLSNFSLLNQKIKSYQNEINNILINPEEINFNTLVNQSYFFQWMIMNNYEIPFKFISNSLPFFSTQENYNFTKSNITQSFIFIINHPHEIYKILKNENNNDQEIARNIFLNLDQKGTKQIIGDTNFILTKKGWHTNTLSWTDANVVNSLKGKIISKKALLENTYEVLSEIILHLIQSGLKIELKYDFIEEYVKNKPLAQSPPLQDISQKEKKFLSGYVEEFIHMYDV